MKLFYILIFLLTFQTGHSQTGAIEWIDFETLEVALGNEPRPVLIYFNAKWCAYCKKMERNAFKDPEVLKILNQKFYAVKMNAESTEEIQFGGRIFRNIQARTIRNGVHELPLLLASRKDRKFTLPALILLDRDFRIKKRSFQYLTSRQLLSFLNEIDSSSTTEN